MKKIIYVFQLIFIVLIPIFFYKINFQISFFENINLICISLIFICLIGFLIGIIISKFLDLQKFINKIQL